MSKEERKTSKKSILKEYKAVSDEGESEEEEEESEEEEINPG